MGSLVSLLGDDDTRVQRRLRRKLPLCLLSVHVGDHRSWLCGTDARAEERKGEKRRRAGDGSKTLIGRRGTKTAFHSVLGAKNIPPCPYPERFACGLEFADLAWSACSLAELPQRPLPFANIRNTVARLIPVSDIAFEAGGNGKSFENDTKEHFTTVFGSLNMSFARRRRRNGYY